MPGHDCAAGAGGRPVRLDVGGAEAVSAQTRANAINGVGKCMPALLVARGAGKGWCDVTQDQRLGLHYIGSDASAGAARGP
jgi:hypothetical protein